MTTTRRTFLAGVASGLLAAATVRAQAAPLRIGVLTAGPLSSGPRRGSRCGHVAVQLLDGRAEGLFSGDVMHQPIQVVRPGRRPDRARLRLGRNMMDGLAPRLPAAAWRADGLSL